MDIEKHKGLLRQVSRNFGPMGKLKGEKKPPSDFVPPVIGCDYQEDEVKPIEVHGTNDDHEPHP